MQVDLRCNEVVDWDNLQDIVKWDDIPLEEASDETLDEDELEDALIEWLSKGF